MEKLRVFEAFAGYGSQSMALERLGIDFEVVGISEIDKYAIQAYMAVHGETKNYGDISKIDWNEVPDFDFFTYSFPCVLAGTKIITDNGYKNVEDVMAGDNVLTHNGRMKEVVRTMSRLSDHFYKVKAIGCDLRITENHPMYVLRNGVEQWVKVKDLKSTDMLSYCIPSANKKTMLPNEYLWLLGRYVADGFINKYLYNSVEFAIGKDKDEEFLKNIPSDMVSRFKVFTKSCLEYRIADKELQDYCRQFGNGALNKKIPQWVIDLPKEQAKIFLMGYLSGDGHLRYRSGTPQWMFSTVSKDLFLGIQQLIMKVFGRVCSLYIRNDKRKQTFNVTYNGQVSIIESKNQVTIGNRIFVRINKIERIKRDVQVYNMEVKDDNSYTCDNVNVHNCQDISNAGEQRGLEEGSGTRSSLLWECKKTIEAKKPKYLLMENVKALTSQKFKPYLKKWTAYLESLGYTCYTKVLNSKNYGVPQNRDRCFMVSILGDESFFFPEGFPLETRLKDVLEKNVDEKYYLSKKLITGFLNTSNNPNHCHKFTPKDGDDIAFTIRTKAGSRVDDNFIKVETESVYGNKRVQSLVESGKIDGDHVQFLDAYNQAVSDDVAGTIRTTIDSSCMHFVTEPKLKRIGNIYGEKCGSNFAGNVYDKEGISPALTTMGGGNREPMIIEPLNADKEGLARTIKAQYYKNGMANLRRQDGCGATGVIEISEPVAIGYTRDKKGKIIKRHTMDVVNTIHTSTGQGGNTDCLIAEPNVLTPKRTEYGKAIRKEYESGKLEESRHNMTEMQPRTDGVSNTITTVQKDNLLVETMPEGMASQSYRIRKLTPRECFRLMGVSDSDIDKIEKAGISRTQQYRMAGNSIVVDVLCHIFRKMFLDKECESKQLYLF